MNGVRICSVRTDDHITCGWLFSKMGETTHHAGECICNFFPKIFRCPWRLRRFIRRKINSHFVKSRRVKRFLLADRTLSNISIARILIDSCKVVADIAPFISWRKRWSKRLMMQQRLSNSIRRHDNRKWAMKVREDIHLLAIISRWCLAAEYWERDGFILDLFRSPLTSAFTLESLTPESTYRRLPKHYLRTLPIIAYSWKLLQALSPNIHQQI